MIELNEETQKKLEFRTRAEKYGPQLRAKFKCWNSTNFPICGVTDKYFVIYRGRFCITNPKLVVVFVDRLPDGSVGEGWELSTFYYNDCYYDLENKIPTGILNLIGDREKGLNRRYKTGPFAEQEETDPFADFKTLADWAPKK